MKRRWGNDHHDPVCGKRLNPNRAHVTVTYQGTTYLLCCPRCQSEFENDPARYVRFPGNRRSAGRGREGR